MAACTASAVTRSINVMEPFSSPVSASPSSLVRSTTSSNGEPIATTSRSCGAWSPSAAGAADGPGSTRMRARSENLLWVRQVAFPGCTHPPPRPPARPVRRTSACPARWNPRPTAWRSGPSGVGLLLRHLVGRRARARSGQRDGAERGRAGRERRRDRDGRRQHAAVRRLVRRRAGAGDLPPAGSCPGSVHRRAAASRAPSTTSCEGSTDPRTRTPTARCQLIATTQFESVDARRAFPCWDEPDRKAVFEVTLLVDPAVEAYSNSPVISSEIVREERRALRAHHEDVDLPGRVRRRPVRDDRDRRRRRRSAPRRVHAREARSGRLRPRRGRSRCASSASTSTSPIPATRWTSSPSRISPPGRWRTWAASPSGTPRSW